MLILLLFKSDLLCTSDSGYLRYLFLELGFDYTKFTLILLLNLFFKLGLLLLILQPKLALNINFSLGCKCQCSFFNLQFKFFQKSVLEFCFFGLIFNLHLPFLLSKLFVIVGRDSFVYLGFNFATFVDFLLYFNPHIFLHLTYCFLLNFGF